MSVAWDNESRFTTLECRGRSPAQWNKRYTVDRCRPSVFPLTQQYMEGLRRYIPLCGVVSLCISDPAMSNSRRQRQRDSVTVAMREQLKKQQIVLS